MLLPYYRDQRYQIKIGFIIYLMIALNTMSVPKLLRSHDWKSGRSVKVIATITQSTYRRVGQKHENEKVEYLMTELQNEGEMVKKIDAKHLSKDEML